MSTEVFNYELVAMDELRPKVGGAVFIFQDDQILLGKRKWSHGEGTWAVPGGHLEFGESLEESMRREILEETGVTLKNFRTLGIFTNDLFPEKNKHYITLYAYAEIDSGTVTVCEPDKCERFDWFSLDSLPSPLFLPIKTLLAKVPDPRTIGTNQWS